jgi:phosphohistidine phosphatase
MNLYLMRHAIAAESAADVSDSQRALTAEGRNKLKQIVRNFKKLDLAFDLILTSPYVRAHQTAAMVAVAQGLNPKQVRISEALMPMGSPEALIAEINAYPRVENLLLVGHEPSLSQLVGLLLAGDSTLDINFKKAGLCKLTVAQCINGRCAVLEWLLAPAQLMAF